MNINIKIKSPPSVNKNNKIILSTYNKCVKFGIPKSSSKRVDKAGKVGLNNAEILQIMEAGSIRMNIPPRKVLEPVVIKWRARIEKYFQQIFTCLVQKDKQKADWYMSELALFVETKAKAYFTQDNGWQPNAPITIHGGWMINKVTGQPVYIKGKKSSKPLIDTGELRKAIRGLVVDLD